MRKISSIIIFVFILILFISQAGAMQVAAGTKLWLVGWDPWFKKIYANPLPEMPTTSFKMQGTIMAGPSVSFIFGDWGVSTAFSYGRFKGEASRSGTVGNVRYVTSGLLSVTRSDFDLALSYTLMPGLRIFGGLKTQVYQIDAREVITQSTNNTIFDLRTQNMNVTSPFNGPGLGAGYTYHFGNFFIGASLAYVFLKGDYKIGSYINQTEGAVLGLSQTPSDYVIKVESVGVTFEPLFGFRAGERAVLILGIRGQTLKSTMKSLKEENDYALPMQGENGERIYESQEQDLFGGVSLSLSMIF